jgi:tRNA A-37 threonylcarbamoyl transferase component Bud32
MQGIQVPTVFTDVRLAPQHSTTGKDKSLTQYTGTRAILIEYIPDFVLSDVVTEVPESDWAPICDQAIEVIMKITNNDFINLDIETQNIIVRPNGGGSYQVFYLDFGECGFRNQSDSDEVWRERER